MFICPGCVVQCVELLADEQLLPVRNRLVQQLAEVARRYPEDAELQAVVGPIVTAMTGPCAEVAELMARHAEARQEILRLRGQVARLAARVAKRHAGSCSPLTTWRQDSGHPRLRRPTR